MVPEGMSGGGGQPLDTGPQPGFLPSWAAELL